MSRARNLAGFGSAIQQVQNPTNLNVGVVTAIKLYGDGSELTGTPGGLGTSLLPDDLTSPLNKIYYTDKDLSIGSTITVDPPDSSRVAYTQYSNIVLTGDADLIIGDGDDFIPDILGIGTETVDQPGVLSTGEGKLRVDNITSKTGFSSPAFPYGLTVNTGTAATITGTLEVDAGSATQPKITAIGDTNTGVFFPSADELAVTNGGSESIRINSSGNVGLGTISPDVGVRLQIEDSSPVLRLNHTGSGTGDILGSVQFGSPGDANCAAIYALHDGSTTSGALSFRTEATGGNIEERLRITSGGIIQVGAGNTLLLGDSNPTANTVYNYESIGNGAIRKYYVTDSLNSAQSTRFSFTGTDRTCAMITINAAGSWTASNTATNHVAAQFVCRVFTNSSGDSADSSTITTPFAYTYSSASHYTFTNGGSNAYTIDIDNPTGDDGVTFFYEVIVHNANPGSQHRMTASSTV